MKNEEIIIDGTKTPIGRIAAYAAKQALEGNTIVVVNVEHAVITGNRRMILDDYQERRHRTGSNQKGPRFPLHPEKVMKRAIRGMLPDHRVGKGREAWKRVRCYMGVPEKYVAGKKMNFAKDHLGKHITLAELYG